MPSKAIKIPLHAVESFLYNGEVKDERCLGPGRWILEIQSPIGEADLIRNVPKLTKVCSARFVVELIKRALPGLTLNYLSVPPVQIAARVESHYFSITAQRPLLGTHRANPAGGHLRPGRRFPLRNSASSSSSTSSRTRPDEVCFLFGRSLAQY